MKYLGSIQILGGLKMIADICTPKMIDKNEHNKFILPYIIAGTFT